MARECTICGKGSNTAVSIVRRGKAKRLGGVGKKTTGLTKRSQKPNLQKIKIIYNGAPKRVRVCTNCIKSGKVERAL